MALRGCSVHYTQRYKCINVCPDCGRVKYMNISCKLLSACCQMWGVNEALGLQSIIYVTELIHVFLHLLMHNLCLFF